MGDSAPCPHPHPLWLGPADAAILKDETWILH